MFSSILSKKLQKKLLSIFNCITSSLFLSYNVERLIIFLFLMIFNSDYHLEIGLIGHTTSEVLYVVFALKEVDEPNRT